MTPFAPLSIHIRGQFVLRLFAANLSAIPAHWHYVLAHCPCPSTTRSAVMCCFGPKSHHITITFHWQCARSTFAPMLETHERILQHTIRVTKKASNRWMVHHTPHSVGSADAAMVSGQMGTSTGAGGQTRKRERATGGNGYPFWSSSSPFSVQRMCVQLKLERVVCTRDVGMCHFILAHWYIPQCGVPQPPAARAITHMEWGDPPPMCVTQTSILRTLTTTDQKVLMDIGGRCDRPSLCISHLDKNNTNQQQRKKKHVYVSQETESGVEDAIRTTTTNK